MKPLIADFQVPAIQKLLKNINGRKGAGPDKIIPSHQNIVKPAWTDHHTGHYHQHWADNYTKSLEICHD